MANTINWGQGSVNNTIGYGQGAKVGSSSFSNTQSTEYDGIDDYVEVADNSNLSFERTDSFSVSVWFKKLSLSGAQFIIGKNENASPRSGYFAFTSANLVKFRITQSNGNNIEIRHNIAHNLNVWEHYVFTYDGSSASSGLNMYQNGTLLTNVTRSGANLTQTTQTSVPLTIGSREGLGLFFNGEIDESAVFNSELSQSDVTTIYNGGVPNDISSISGLVSWWRFEGTGTTATDSGSGGNNGTLTNGVTRSTDVPT